MTHWLTTTPLAVFDLESTGLDTAEDRIVQIAILQIDGGKPGRFWSSLIDPGCFIPPESSAVHGITDRDVIHAPRIAAVAPTILGLIRGRGLVAYNGARFDLPMLRCELARSGVSIRDRRVLDPLVWVREVDRFVRGSGRHKLTAVCERWGIELDGQAHDARTDVRACWRVLEALPERVPEWADLGIGAVLDRQDALTRQQEEDFARWLAKQPARQAG